MSRDSSFTHLHLTHSKLADFSDEFSRPMLPAPDLQIASEHQPPNPEDEDDVVPDQHAAFGIQRATQSRREPEWRDLGLAELLAGEGRSGVRGVVAGGGIGAGAGARVSEATREVIRASLERREAGQGMGGASAARSTNGGNVNR